MTSTQAQAAVMIAADSVQALRRCDVFRVLEQNASQIRGSLAAFIAAARPDLADEVADIMAEGF